MSSKLRSVSTTTASGPTGDATGPAVGADASDGGAVDGVPAPQAAARRAMVARTAATRPAMP